MSNVNLKKICARCGLYIDSPAFKCSRNEHGRLVYRHLHVAECEKARKQAAFRAQRRQRLSGAELIERQDAIIRIAAALGISLDEYEVQNLAYTGHDSPTMIRDYARLRNERKGGA